MQNAPSTVIHEPARTIPVVCEADLCVVGGSCTGLFAAVRAARLGASVAIVEKHNCFGGMATAGAVSIWHSRFDTTGERPIIGGLTVEVLDRLRRVGAVQEDSSPNTAFRLNTEELKIELDALLVEHRIRPFLHSFYVAPILADADRLEAVVIENKSGRQAIRARQFIDATGDADVARDLKLPTIGGGGGRQPPTTCAKVLGLDGLRPFDWVAAVREHGAEFGLEPDWGWGTVIPGLPGIEMRADAHVFGLDTLDGDQLSQAEIAGRRHVRAILDVIRAYAPPDRPVALADLAATLGIRETPRIAARTIVTGDDVLHGRRFADAIANGSYRVDIHHDDGPGITFRYLDGREQVVPERGADSRWGRWREPLPQDPTFYQIPFGALLPPRVRNLALAGRLLGADKTAFSALRVMVNMNQTGEAAGVAAVLAMRAGGAIGDVQPAKLRAELAAGGSIMI